MVSSGEFGRRSLLIAGAGLLAGCSDGSGSTKPSASFDGPTPTGPMPPSSAPGSSPTVLPTPPTPALPAVRTWSPGAGEIKPEVKATAVAAVVKLLQKANSAVEVIDAQYGGILNSTASVLVPCRVYTLTNGNLTTGGTTVDVRLARSGTTWRVTALHPARPGAPAKTLTRAARQVLASDRISLPPASAADIRSGTIHDTVLTAMLELANTYRIGISVIRSGHPLDVFGTTRPSDHPQGRAFDTWQINNRAVVDPTTPRSLITAYMRAAASTGSYNVGGPYQLSGSTYFSDDTHHDHVHAGYSM
jgi:hypothetical protein